MRDTFRFFRLEWRFLGFGLLLSFASSFGQTFYIALFSAEVRGAFDLSHGDFGAVYSAATLLSAAVLAWAGKGLDRIDLRLFVAVVLLGLAAASGVFALAPGVAGLGLALFLLRLFGQGLSPHIAFASMARYYTAARGRAVGFVALGQPFGEAVFPALAVAVIALIGWRGAWGAGVALILFALLPLALWLLKGHAVRHADWQAAHAAATANGDGERDWSRAAVLRDPRFYMVLPVALAGAFIVTGFFFHQVHLFAVKGWSLALLAAAFTGYAVATAATALLAGPVVDRLGAARLLPAVLVPLVLSLGCAAAFEAPAAAVAYLLLAGVAMGLQNTVLTPLWAELYGTAHIGAIRALFTALSVLASAGSPILFGVLIDGGVTLESIALACMAYCLAAIALAWAAVRRPAAAAA